MNKVNPRVGRFRVLCILIAAGLVGCHAQRPRSSGELVRYGGMHETIGQKQHHGRVRVSDATQRPHFYALGALEGLRGELTVHDSVATATGVTNGRLAALRPADTQATLLVGQSVDEWTRVTLRDAVSHTQFDEAVANAASEAGVDATSPFMFVIDGTFTEVRLHVMNGACPVHARMKKLELPSDARPFELEAATLAGTLVGVYAAHSVGELTHPATSTHAHLLYTNPDSGERVTGHLEQVGLAPGAVLKLPKPAVQPAQAAHPGPPRR